jgi:large exoprotein involved in heme utilization and adhesion
VLSTESADGAPPGRILIRGGQLTLRESSVASANYEQADASAVELAATGDLTVSASNITSETGWSGRGADVILMAENVTVEHASDVKSVAWGDGRGGDIRLTASGAARVLAAPEDGFDFTAVFSETYGAGTAGDLRLRGDAVIVSAPSLYSYTAGAGNTGSIVMRGRDIDITRGAFITTQSDWGTTGGTGKIDIAATGRLVTGGADWTGFRTIVFTQTLGSGRGGDILLRGEDISVVDGVRIISVAAGAGGGGDIDIAASRRFYASNRIPVPHEQQWNNGIYSLALGAGDAGNIGIAAPELTLLGSFVHSGAHATGNAGTLRFAGDVVRFLGGNNNIAFVESGAANFSSGKGGNVEVRARDRFELNGTGFPQDWTRLAATTQGSGRSGEILIEAPRILIENATVFSRTRFGTGDQGGVTLRAEELRLGHQGGIVSGTEGDRKGSFVLVEADTVHMSGFSRIATSTGSSGDAGRVTINARQMTLTDASQIDAISTGTGRAGDIVLNVGESFEISGREIVNYVDLFAGPQTVWPGGILSQALGPGDAGNVQLRARNVLLDDGRILTNALQSGAGGFVEIRAANLTMRNGAQIDARSAEGSSGNAGSIDIVLSGSLLIDGRSPVDGAFSGLYVQTQGSGRGGNIAVGASRVDIVAGGRIEGKSTGAGDAGSINIVASDALRLVGGTISSEALNADGGNIDIRVGNLVHLRNSEITTAVGSGAGAGGNIFIDPTFVILENSRITANAFGGPGGNIQIIATYFLNTLNSLVDASSQAGVPGTVSISAPNTNLSTQLKVLPATFFDATQLVREACSGRGVAGGGGSSLVGVGRGGLAASPERFATSTYFGNAPAAAASAPTGTGLKLATATRARLVANCSS